MALHEQSVGASDEWYTPPRVFEALGCCLFDIDVASPGQAVTPWIPALHFLTHDSLSMKWNGYVWMNAPFGARMGLVPWIKKFIEHGNGICLVRTELVARGGSCGSREWSLSCSLAAKLNLSVVTDCRVNPQRKGPVWAELVTVLMKPCTAPPPAG
jgi:hypothetical protein